MKKYLVVTAVVFFGIYMFGCRKKQMTMEESGEPMSMEALNATDTSVSAAQEAKPQVTQTVSGMEPAKLEVLPAGPYKPTSIEIQTALQHAGLYTGEIDGKIGLKTKMAIEEFQKANGLKADGKVGTKTWALLSSHLNPPVEPKTKKKR